MSHFNTILRKAALTLTGLLWLATTATAAGVQIQDGKTYTIRSNNRNFYLGLNRTSDTFTTAANLTFNDPYQMWTVHLTDDKIKLQNLGNPDKWVSAPASVARNGAITPSATSATAHAYTLIDRTSGDNIQYELNYNSSFSMNAGAGTVVAWDAGNAANNLWTFQEAELITPKVVELQNRDNSRWMTASGTSVQHKTAKDGDNSRWIMYPSGESKYYIINYATHRYIQAISKDAAATLAANPIIFDIERNDEYYLFNYSGQYLNRFSNGNVGGWNQGTSDNGSQWTMVEVADVTVTYEQLYEWVNDCYITNPAPGTYFRLYNIGRPNYAYDDTNSGQMRGANYNATDYNQVWQLTGNAGAYHLTNALTSREVLWDNSLSRIQMAASGNGSEITLSRSTNIQASFSITKNTITNGDAIHLDSNGDCIKWNYAAGGSQWRIEPVTVNEEELAAARADFASSVDIIANVANYQTVLDQLFTDKACTTLKTLSDSEYNTLYAQLPTMLQRMCDQIKNNTWKTYDSGRNWDKLFRIRSYNAISNNDYGGMTGVVGLDYNFSRLNHPTGIKGATNELMAIMVDSDAPTGATLKLEVQSGFGMSGTQYALHQGLNVITMPRDCNLFVHYMLNSATDDPDNYLSKYNDIKIHIEGGTVYGTLDRNRVETVETTSGANETYDMTNADKATRRAAANKMWQDMQADGLIANNQMTHVKSECVLFNFNSGAFLRSCPTDIAEVTDIWDYVLKSQHFVMGLRNDWTKPGQNGELIDTYIPNLSKRFNNVYMASERSGGYMNATGYGAQYETSTLSSILTLNNLKAGGAQWGPAHEHGHDNQKLINMAGCTEISNNLLANVSNYFFGALVSRGASLPTIMETYANGKHWVDNAYNLWTSTQMYYKLFLYYHAAGKDETFYPRLFQKLRQTPLNHRSNVAIPANEDYLRFAMFCCEVAHEDLSEFFEAYGMLRPIVLGENTTSVGGYDCRTLADYSTFYLYTTDQMLADAKAFMQAQGPKNTSILFIDDRVGYTPATSEYAEPGAVKANRGDGGTVGTLGDVGSVASFRDGAEASAYSATFTDNGDGTIRVTMSGTGAAGYIIRDAEGNILYFSAYNEFTIPATVVTKAGGTETLLASLPTALVVETPQGNELALNEAEEPAAASHHLIANNGAALGTVSNSQYHYTSETLAVPATSRLRFTFLATTQSQNVEPAGHPYVHFAEFGINKVEGSVSTKLNLTADNFSSNATQAGDGNLAALCDGLCTTAQGSGNDWYWHSSWDAAIADYHYLDITMPEGETISNFTFSYVTRNTNCIPTRILIEAYNDATADFHPITVNYIYDGKVVKTETTQRTYGMTYETIGNAYANSYVAHTHAVADSERVTSAANNSVSITFNAITDEMPFKLSQLTDGAFGDNMHWHQIKVMRSPAKYYHYSLANNYCTADANDTKTAADLFAFTGNPVTGYRIYNYVAGANRLVWSSNLNSPLLLTPVADVQDGHDWMLTKNGATGFVLRRNGDTNGWMNENAGKLGYWNDAAGANDLGSTNLFPEVTGEELQAAINATKFPTFQDANGNAVVPGRYYAIQADRNPIVIPYANLSGSNYMLPIYKTALATQSDALAWTFENACDGNILIKSVKYNKYLDQKTDNEGNGGANIRPDSDLPATKFTVEAYSGNNETTHFYALKTVKSGRTSKYLSNYGGTSATYMGLYGTGTTDGGSRLKFVPLNVINLRLVSPDGTETTNFAYTLNGTEYTGNVSTTKAFSEITAFGGSFDITGTTYTLGGATYNTAADLVTALQSVTDCQADIVIHMTITPEQLATLVRAEQVRDTYKALPEAIRADGYVNNYNAANHITNLETAITDKDFTTMESLLTSIGEKNTFSNNKLYKVVNAKNTGCCLEGNATNGYPYASNKTGNTYDATSPAFQWMVYDDGFNKMLYNVAVKGALNSTNGATKQNNWQLLKTPAHYQNIYMTITPDTDTPFIFNVKDTERTAASACLHNQTEGYTYGLTNWNPYASSPASGWLFCEIREASQQETDDLMACINYALPKPGSLIRLKGKVSSKYITAPATASANGTNAPMLAEAEATNNVFAYTTDRRLVNYNTGIALGQTCMALAYTNEATADHFTFGMGNSVPAGYFTCRSDFSGSQWLYDNGGNAKADRYNTFAANNCAWTVETLTTLPITITAAKAATLNLPAACRLPEGMKAYTALSFKNASEARLILQLVQPEEDGTTLLPANTPVFLWADPAEYTIDLNVAVTTEIEDNLFDGTTAAIAHDTNDDTMVLGLESTTDDLGFFRTTSPYINGFRAYLTDNTVTDLFTTSSGNVRAMKISFADITTAIEAAEANLPEGRIYDLNGRQVKRVAKGAYIVNGKTIVVK